MQNMHNQRKNEMITFRRNYIKTRRKNKLCKINESQTFQTPNSCLQEPDEGSGHAALFIQQLIFFGPFRPRIWVASAITLRALLFSVYKDKWFCGALHIPEANKCCIAGERACRPEEMSQFNWRCWHRWPKRVVSECRYNKGAQAEVRYVRIHICRWMMMFKSNGCLWRNIIVREFSFTVIQSNDV